MSSLQILVIKRLKEYHEKLYANEFYNLDETKKCLQRYKLSKLTQEEWIATYTPGPFGRIEFVAKTLPTSKNPDPEGFTRNSPKYL